ncbi:dCTP deaminase domain-containing protein [Deefgea rivuli]|uniref:dCTP deaminase domain-containing protein n=1 Tax=Deefgea rivuli TaxID=400948 RepID=UPI00048337DD|nr:hypothetical protein [Deefgea rivuli]
MSIVQIKGRTSTSEEEFNNYALSSNSFIYTDAEKIEEFSIELTLGEGWNENYSEHNRNLFQIEESITIRGQDSIVVETKERISIPHNRYGIVLPTGSLFLSKGILVASAKIEPAFHGKLQLRIYNTTNRSQKIEKGVKIASAIFFSTESTKVHARTYRSSDISALQKSKIKEIRKWLSNNKTSWIGWIASGIFSSGLTFALTYTLYYKHMLDNKTSPPAQHNQTPPAQSKNQNTQIKTP